MKSSRQIYGIVFCIITLVLNVLLFTSPAFSQYEEEEFLRAGDWVETAARRPQPISEAPAAVTVITDEDIRQSGATTIPEVLRRVAGVDVVTLTAFDSQLSIRGFARSIAEKILVLVDGRSVYLDLVGCTLWEALPIQLEEIERIEVVKGPVSVLYGANAFLGVVNIITRKAPVYQGGSISVAAGSPPRYIGSMIYGKSLEKLDLKVSGGYERAARFSDSDQDSEKVVRFNGRADYQVFRGGKVSLEGGLNQGEGEVTVLMPGENSRFSDWYASGAFGLASFRVKTLGRFSRFNLPSASLGIPSLTGVPEDLKGDHSVYDLELENSWNLGRPGRLLGGASYRHLLLNYDFFNVDHDNLWAGFVQYEVSALRNLALNSGLRLDYHGQIGYTLSPRAALIFTPLREHTLRISAGRAFRNPNFIDLYADVSTPLVKVTGGKNLRPELITSYELGYRFPLGKKLQANLDLFYYRLDDLVISFAYGGITAEGIQITAINRGGGEGWGGESELKWRFNSWANGFLNYSFQKIWIEQEGKMQHNPRTNPRHKLNGGLAVEPLKGFSGSVLLSWVDMTRKDHLVSIMPLEWEEVKLDSYLLLNLRLAYRFLNGHLEIAVSGQNLLEPENYRGKLYNYPGADYIPLTIMGTITGNL